MKLSNWYPRILFLTAALAVIGSVSMLALAQAPADDQPPPLPADDQAPADNSVAQPADAQAPADDSVAQPADGGAAIGNAAYYDAATGLTLEILADGSGLKITAVDQFSRAEYAGLEAGDVIVRINGVAMLTQDDFLQTLRRSRGHARLQLLDIRTARIVPHRAFLPVAAGPANAQNAIDLQGWWHSWLGDLELSLNGDQLVGTIHYNDGTHGKIEGRLIGRTIEFTWHRDSAMHGTATLELLPHGYKLAGQYRNSVYGTTGIWMLTR